MDCIPGIPWERTGCVYVLRVMPKSRKAMNVLQSSTMLNFLTSSPYEVKEANVWAVENINKLELELLYAKYEEKEEILENWKKDMKCT